MKKIVLGLLVCLTVSAPAIELHEGKFTMSESELEECRSGGGCVLATRLRINAFIDRKSREFAGSCGNRT